MRTLQSTTGAVTVSQRAWSPLPVGAAFFTLAPALLVNALEVKMTFGSDSGKVESPPVHDVMWTDLASGGCTPFAIVIRDAATDNSLAFALAHLCYSADVEAHDMGVALRAHVGAAANTYAIIMKKHDIYSDLDERYFTDFGRGFGAAIPPSNRILLRTQGVNGVITRNGIFGEVDAMGIFLLQGGRRPGGQGCCVLL